MQELKFTDFCANCRTSLEEVEKFYFVEQEVGRCFCTETCIVDYFLPKIESMKEEWKQQHQGHDIQESSFKRFAHYQQLTLSDPDEIWVETTDLGEKFYSYISHFHEQQKAFSYVVVCLAINETPSFVFLSFPTKDESLVQHYRKGVSLKGPEKENSEHVVSKLAKNRSYPDGEELAEVIPIESAINQKNTQAENPNPDNVSPNDFPTLHRMLRQPNDIPIEEAESFLDFVEPTIEDPDEIWRYIDDEGNEWYTFISKHTLGPDQEHASGVDEFYIVAVCDSIWDEETKLPGFEVLYAFPTIDPSLIQYFRKGINSLNKSFGVAGTRSRAA